MVRLAHAGADMFSFDLLFQILRHAAEFGDHGVDVAQFATFLGQVEGGGPDQGFA